MELDTDKIDQAVLALFALGRHDGSRTWKAFDWEVMGRLHAKVYISDPMNKAKSMLFTERLDVLVSIVSNILNCHMEVATDVSP